jgi:hypothetical protein
MLLLLLLLLQPASCCVHDWCSAWRHCTLSLQICRKQTPGGAGAGSSCAVLHQSSTVAKAHPPETSTQLCEHVTVDADLQPALCTAIVLTCSSKSCSSCVQRCAVLMPAGVLLLRRPAPAAAAAAAAGPPASPYNSMWEAARQNIIFCWFAQYSQRCGGNCGLAAGHR